MIMLGTVGSFVGYHCSGCRPCRVLTAYIRVCSEVYYIPNIMYIYVLEDYLTFHKLLAHFSVFNKRYRYCTAKFAHRFVLDTKQIMFWKVVYNWHSLSMFSSLHCLPPTHIRKAKLSS